MPVYFRPHGLLTDAPKPRSDRDIALYDQIAEAIGTAVHPVDGVDYEDWMEPAALFKALLDAGVEIHVLEKKPLDKTLDTPLYIIPGRSTQPILMGRVLTQDHFHLDTFGFVWPPKNADLANQYGELEAFARNAGRKTALTHFPGDIGTTLPKLGTREGVDIDTALSTFEEGPLVVKQTWPAKAHSPVFTSKTKRDGASLLFDAFDFSVCQYEGNQNAILLQEQLCLSHETRFFVLNHKVVTGAACIEAHTPQQYQGTEPLYPVFEVKRNKGPLVHNPKLGKRLWEAAERFAQEIATEAPALGFYTLDLATDPNGHILILELNPAYAAGLYAINATLLVNAILDATQ